MGAVMTNAVTITKFNCSRTVFAVLFVSSIVLNVNAKNSEITSLSSLQPNVYDSDTTAEEYNADKLDSTEQLESDYSDDYSDQSAIINSNYLPSIPVGSSDIPQNKPVNNVYVLTTLLYDRIHYYFNYPTHSANTTSDNIASDVADDKSEISVDASCTVQPNVVSNESHPKES